MSYSLLADMTLVLHAGYALFVVGGQLLILVGWAANWNWPRNLWFRILHLIAIGFVMLEAWVGVICPLTTLENLFRQKAGRELYENSFISDWVGRLLFYTAPEWVFILIYTAFFLLILVSWWGYRPVKR